METDKLLLVAATFIIGFLLLDDIIEGVYERRAKEEDDE